jgi:ATP-binding cassette subfamily B protein
MSMRKKVAADENLIKQTLHLYWQELRKHKPMLIAGLVLLPFAIFFSHYANSWIIAQVINDLTTKTIAQSDLWSHFAPWIAAYIGSYLLGELILWRIGLIVIWRLESKMVYGLNRRSFEALSSQSLDFHSNRFGGSLVSQVNKFSNAYVILSSMATFSLIPLLSSFVFTFAILGPQLPLFTLGLALLSALFMTIAALSFRPIRKLNAVEAESQTRLSGQLADSITNIMAVKSHGSESFEQGRYDELNKTSYKASVAVMRSIMRRDIAFGAVITVISSFALITLIGGQGWFGVPLGTLILATTFSGQVLGQLWGFNNILRSTSRAFGDAQEMTKNLGAAHSVTDVATAPALKATNGALRFQDVTFRHGDSKSDEPALFEDFNLAIKPGEHIGLVGQSGSGKTTLTRLLLRFADIESGAITIDGQNIAEVSQQSLRSSIAYVPQEPLLFHRSLIDNIRYGKPDASDKEVEKAAKQANALEFIKKLPDGFDTMVGERGIKLSGGQRQRIAIARAILRDAPILLLDEATSALDSESEALIQDALTKLMKGRTSIVIAHRLSTIAALDKIVVLKEGAIVEQGSHKQLLESKGAYAKLWNHQSGGFIES